MSIIDVFMQFINDILSFKIMGIPLYGYLFTITVIELVVQMLAALKDR